MKTHIMKPDDDLDVDGNTRKRQKFIISTRSQQPPIFWDNLSTIYLTRSALQELQRRTATSTSTVARPHKSFCADEYMGDSSAVIRADLKRFARHGGPDMSEARGHQRPPHDSQCARGFAPVAQVPTQVLTPTTTDPPSTKTSTIFARSGPYDQNFAQILTDNNIFHNQYRYPDGTKPPLPCNWEEIKERLRKPILSLKVTEDDYEKFTTADAFAFKELQVVISVVPLIVGNDKDALCTAGGIPLGNLDQLTDRPTTPGNPDIFYGARPESLDRIVRTELAGSIVPTTQDNLPICPNFFVAIKGPKGSQFVALLQALYDGTLGARGIYDLQNYRRPQTTFNSMASTITCIYYGGMLSMYTISRTDLRGKPAYYMHQLNSWAMKGNLDTYREGLIAYRNARDWAEEQRNSAIKHANQAIENQKKKKRGGEQ